MKEGDRARSRSGSSARGVDEALAPGRASRSSQLDAPARPLISGLLQRKVTRDSQDADAEDAVAAASTTSGVALPDPILRKFESSLGADLSSVRVHAGDTSALAAGAVGARAYTVGQDIHFAAGEYDPTSRAGEELLAHEVAHTVQQRGGSATRQHKLTVSASNDSAEHEADRAAEAMVAGMPAAIGSGAMQLQRKTAPPATTDKTWAEATRATIRTLKTTANDRLAVLNADAAVAATAFRSALRSYEKFEEKYDAALTRFLTGVRKASEEAQELRERVTAAAELTFAAATLGVGGFVYGGAEIVEVCEGIEKVVSTTGSLKGLFGSAPETEEHEPEQKSPEVRWDKLLDRAIDTLEGLQLRERAFLTIATKCDASEWYLSDVVEGKIKGDARSSESGKAADAIASQASTAQKALGSIQPGVLSAKATSFSARCTERLDSADETKLEKDIAIRWLGSLDEGSESKIDDADEYLKAIGVIDGKGSRLGVDTGHWTTDSDCKLIRLRAAAESRAMSLVGNTATWLGFDGTVSWVRDMHGERWRAVGTGDVKAGGVVKVVGYQVDPPDEQERGRPDANLAQMDVALHVVPAETRDSDDGEKVVD